MAVAEIVLREAVLLVVLGALGSGVVATLGRRLAPGVRIALAPAAGLAVAACVLTTVHAVLPMRVAAWAVLLPLVVLSFAVAWRARRGGGEAVEDHGGPVRRDLAAMAVMVVLAGGVLASPLVATGSQGPMGLSVFDSNSYVGFALAARDHTLQVDISRLQENPDLTFRNWAFYSKSFVLIRSDNLSAAVSEWFGWRSSDVQAPYMAVMLLIGALAAFALVRQLIGGAPWLAAAAGGLFAGPLFMQLYLDGSEGILGGLALLPAALLATAQLIGRPTGARELALAGLLAAGLQSLHPVFMVLVGLWGATIAGLAALHLLARRRAGVRAVLRTAGIPLAAVGVLTAVLSPVALLFNFRFYDWARGNFYTQGLPEYQLPIQVLPSWLLQTREFFFLPPGISRAQDAVLTFLAPAALAAVMAFGLLRVRGGWLVGALVPAIAVFGVFAWQQDCSYCVQRNLIPAGAVGVLALGLGLGALWRSGRVLRAAAVGVAVAALVMAWQKSLVETERLANGGYAVPEEAREVAQALEGRDGDVMLEALGQGRNGPAIMEMTALYNLVNEHTHERLALSIETNDYSGLAYLIGQRPPATQYGPEYTPGFRWVWTRIGDVETDRRTVRREGPFALQERTGPFDVSVTSGVAVDRLERDRAGRAWVQGPMTYWVAAREAGRAYARLVFERPRGLRVVPTLAPGAEVVRRTPTSIEVCVPVDGTRPGLRRMTLGLDFAQGPELPPPAGEQFAPPSPPKVVRLDAMRASSTPCA